MYREPDMPSYRQLMITGTVYYKIYFKQSALNYFTVQYMFISLSYTLLSLSWVHSATMHFATL